jgi:DNA-directed RNA polymerase specialized sigma subunit
MATEYLNNRELEQHIATFLASTRAKAKYQLIMEDIQEAISTKEKRQIPTQEDKQLLTTTKKSYAKADDDFAVAQQQLALDFYRLSENLVRYAKFPYLDVDDARQEGVVICFEKVDRFVPNKGRAFNYMTTCVLNHFRQLYRTAKNQNELKKKYRDFQQTRTSKTMIKNGKELPVYHGLL